MSRPSQGALILAIGAVLFSILFLVRREVRPAGPGPEPARTKLDPVPPPRPEKAAVAKTDVEDEDPPQKVRVQKLDGTFEMIEQKVASQWMEDARTLFDAEMNRFSEEFHQKVEEEGPAAALQFLAPWLRAATEDVLERARIFKAVECLVWIQRKLSYSEPGSSTFEPVRAAATARLVGYLRNPAVDVEGKELAVGALGNVSTTILARGRSGRERDGILTYDLSEPIHFNVYTSSPTPFELKEAIAGSNRMLRNPDVVDVLLKLFEDPSTHVLVRSPVLRALCGRPELLDRVNLPGLAVQPQERWMEEAIVHAFSVRSDLMTSQVFSSMIEGEWDVEAKGLMWERFPDRVFEGDRKIDLVSRSLPIRPAGDLSDAADWVYRDRVLAVVLERYGTRKDKDLFDLLVGRFQDWAPADWSAGDMPIVVIANFAAKGGLKEFAPHLRGVREAISMPNARVLIESALGTLDER